MRVAGESLIGGVDPAGRIGSLALQTLGGRRLDVLISVALPGPGEPLDTLLVSLSDITDRKRAEIALRQEIDVRTTLARVGQSLAGELRSEQLIQAVPTPRRNSPRRNSARSSIT
jgi:hypothetical protein